MIAENPAFSIVQRNKSLGRITTMTANPTFNNSVMNHVEGGDILATYGDAWRSTIVDVDFIAKEV